jgi:hypothetical protein
MVLTTLFIIFSRNLNVYEAVLPDRMHHIDLGLFKYMLDYTQELLIKQCGNWAIERFNNRLAAIPKFPGLKIFNNGISSVQTADEHRMVMKVIISIIDGMFDNEDCKNLLVSSNQLISVYHSFICMYIMSRKEEFSEEDLTVFEVLY